MVIFPKSYKIREIFGEFSQKTIFSGKIRRIFPKVIKLGKKWKYFPKIKEKFRFYFPDIFTIIL